MRRLCLIFALAVCSLPAGEPKLDDLLKAVEKRYNRAQTLEVMFSESYSAQGRLRKPETGTLFLRKPGRMRWQYTSPAGKLFVSDGKYLYLYTPDANRVEKMRAKNSEDMRAPLAFLLGRLHFESDFQNFRARPEGVDTWIAADPKNPNLPYAKVEFEVAADYQIRRVRVTGQDQSVMDFRFDQEKVNPPLDGKLFEFHTPPGAEVAEVTR